MIRTRTRLDPEETRTADSHTREVVDAVMESALFTGIDRAEIATILSSFDEQSFNAGHRITLEGYRGSDFYVVAAGRAAVTVEGTQVATLDAGDYFGEMGVLGDGLRVATVAAETPLRCLVLANKGLEALIAAHPQIGINLLHQVVSRFQGLNQVRDLLSERHPVPR